MALATYKDLCIDAVDVPTLGRFWAGALALDLELHDDGDARLSGPTDRDTVWLNAVPEPVTVKQRVHLDVFARSVDDVLGLGASPEDLVSFRWKVLRDPEGGELCVFEREQSAERRLMEIIVSESNRLSGILEEFLRFETPTLFVARVPLECRHGVWSLDLQRLLDTVRDTGGRA